MQSPRRLAVAVFSMSVLGLVAGCGGSAKPTPSSGPATSASSTPVAATTSSAVALPSTSAPSSPDPTAQAKEGALDTYKKVVDITTREFATNQVQSDLLTYAYSNALLFFHQSLTFHVNHNVVLVGAPQSSPVVTDVDMSSTPHRATITDCFGGPNYKEVFASDKDGHKKGDSAIVAGSSLAPHVVTAVLEDKGDHWLMINYMVSDKTC